MVKNLISSGVEDHTFGPINLRENFPEEELTLGKNRFLEVASLVATLRLLVLLVIDSSCN